MKLCQILLVGVVVADSRVEQVNFRNATQNSARFTCWSCCCCLERLYYKFDIFNIKIDETLLVGVVVADSEVEKVNFKKYTQNSARFTC